MGMAYWILPRFSRQPRRGNVSAAWLAFGLLNSGVLLVGFSPWFDHSWPASLAGRAMEAGAALAFAVHAWPRVKAAGVG
jgi:hypothetical protein